MARPPQFDDDFRQNFLDLLLWRRDVRRFRDDKVDENLINELLRQACLAPSVGNSQPWRFVKVFSQARRDAIKQNFLSCNQAALQDHSGSDAALYVRLKLNGLDQAPVHIAVFSENAPKEGKGLGRKTMPEALQYSTVAAINTLWLAARAHGLGLGWLSILEPDAVSDILEAPSSWRFVAYLCLGYPVEEHLDQELARHGWQEKLNFERFVFQK